VADERKAPDHSKPVRLAGAVLGAAVEQDWRKAERYMRRLNDECDSEGLATALIAWCDALAEHANDGMPEFGRVRVLNINVETGARLAELTPEQQWVERLMVARQSGDRSACVALFDELNAIPDGFDRGKYASTLIQGVAGTIRTFPRGYARMGKGQ
jgi:hypothetical protein